MSGDGAANSQDHSDITTFFGGFISAFDDAFSNGPNIVEESKEAYTTGRDTRYDYAHDTLQPYVQTGEQLIFGIDVIVVVGFLLGLVGFGLANRSGAGKSLANDAKPLIRDAKYTLLL